MQQSSKGKITIMNRPMDHAVLQYKIKTLLDRMARKAPVPLDRLPTFPMDSVSLYQYFPTKG